MMRMESLDEQLYDCFDDIQRDEELLSYAEVVDDGETSIEDHVEKVDLKTQMLAALARLNPRAQEIIAMRYGLYDDQIYTLEEVGKMFGLTRERIRQIEATTIDRLRNQKGSRQLKEYLS